MSDFKLMPEEFTGIGSCDLATWLQKIDVWASLKGSQREKKALVMVARFDRWSGVSGLCPNVGRRPQILCETCRPSSTRVCSRKERQSSCNDSDDGEEKATT